MRIDHARYLIVDLEATCAADRSLPREEMEIIEIGAVMLNARTFEIESEFQSFVRPVRHPRLTPFCTKLTTITQEQVDGAPAFPDVLRRLAEWASRFDDWLFCSWGDYDRQQLLQDCAFHRVEYPLGPEHLNLKAEFSRVQNQRRRFGLAAAVRRLGLEFEGTSHRGIDDARNMARLVRRLCAES